MASSSSSKKEEVVMVEARKGRLRQRYDDNGYRLVAGCVPYRLLAGGEVEVLMVSTPNRADLVFPKGGWEEDEDVYEAACREAMEEAGVKGNINRASLGLWVFRSKSSQNRSEAETSTSPRGACKGYIFALEVTEEMEMWPEQDTHGRRWLSPADAFRLCRYDWMREALAALLDRLLPPAPAPEMAPEPISDHAAGVYGLTMLKSSADRAVGLC